MTLNDHVVWRGLVATRFAILIVYRCNYSACSISPDYGRKIVYNIISKIANIGFCIIKAMIARGTNMFRETPS